MLGSFSEKADELEKERREREEMEGMEGTTSPLFGRLINEKSMERGN